ncbi:hypothetical protein LGK97_13825 [Clostridium sp. CS001]|uniref:hypothetical protein n=1 Tax=Clostridium sp. CS001 TaxID=2880648 RepID=UPI001CF1D599|nr:hypothetical protein [Clostridium sp. CS001]MCB2290820.1 hypothetical protein [Clostridium sp. CS001]
MPKISKTRIINVKYNDDRRTIDNAIFDFKDGKHALFSMDNGIGKTVLIQFLLQPFIKDGSYREIGDRPFQDFFNSNSPTVVMHELKMDEGGEYLLIGVLIKTEKDAEGKKKLKFLAFTHNYSYKNSYDIGSIPFVVNENGRKKILSFQESEAMLKKAQKDVKEFKVYNFTDKPQKEEYFNKLAEYRISYREYETLIRKINQKEAGLIALYEGIRTSEELVKKNILPIIEKKINSGKDILKELRDSLNKFIVKYVDQKHILDKLQLFDSFIIDAHTLTPEFEKYKIEHEEFKKTENTLAYLCKYISDKIDEIQSELTVYDDLVREANENIETIQIEELSFKIHDKLIKLDGLIEKMEIDKEQSTDLEAKKHSLSKNISIQRCADEYSNLRKKRNELTEVIERISNLGKGDNVIQLNIKNYRFTLRELYSVKITKLAERIEFIINEVGLYENKIIELETSLTAVGDTKVNIKSETKNNNNIILDNEKAESIFVKTYNDFKLQKNLFGTYDERELISYENKLKKEIEELKTKLIKDKQRLPELKEEIKLLEVERGKADSNVNELNKRLNLKTYELQNFNKDTKEINLIFEKHEIAKDIVKNKEKLLDKLQSDIETYKGDRENIQKNKFSLETELLRLESCSLLDIPKNFKKTLEDNGIDIKQGLQRLKERKDSFEEKLELIEKNPFLPYSLLMSKEEMKTLAGLKINTSTPIPVIDENNLNSPLNAEVLNNLYSVGSMNFYISFSEYLLDDNKRDEKIREIKILITIAKDEMKDIDKTIINLNLELSKINQYKYRGNEDIVLNSEIETTNIAINLGKYKSSAINDSMKNKGTEVDSLTEGILTDTGKMSSLEQKNDKFYELKEKYEKHLKSKSENIVLGNKLKLLLSDEKKLLEELTNLRNKKESSKVKLSEVKTNKGFAEDESLKYTDAIEGIIVDGDIGQIEGSLKACEDSYNSDLKRDTGIQEGLEADVKKSKKLIDRESENKGIVLEDYSDLKYDEETYNLLREEYSKVKTQITELQELFVKNKIAKGGLENNLIELRKILSEHGVECEIPLEKIRNMDFQKSICAEKKRIEDCSEETKDLNNQIVLFKIEAGKLQKYEDVSFSEIEIGKLNIVEVEKLIKETLSKEDKQTSSLVVLRKNIKTKLEIINRNYRDKHEVFKQHLSHLIIEDNTNVIEKGTNLLICILERQINAENMIRQNLNELRNSIVDEIETYGYAIYDELNSIDNNSIITVNNVKRKMLQISMPTKENLNKDGISAYVKSVIELISSDVTLKNIDAELESQINSEQLLSQLVGGLKRISVQIYKVEKYNIKLKYWEELNHENSGAERFVSVFVIFTALLSYVRKRPGDYQNFKEGMIMIMDNPFANTQAEYLLVPMFDIAEKYNVQLICFSGITGSSILNRFDVIYMAKVMRDKYSHNEKVDFSNLHGDNGINETLEISSIAIEQTMIF